MLYGRGEYIDGNCVVLPLKAWHTAELYRVRSQEGKMFLLKLFRPDRLSPLEYNSTGRVRELELFEQTRIEGIANFNSSGTVVKEGARYPYVLLEYIPGSLLGDYIKQGSFRLYSDVIDLIVSVLEIIRRMRIHYPHLVLNALNPDSLLLDTRSETCKPVIINLGHALSLNDYQQDGLCLRIKTLNLAYVSNECFNQAYSIKSDLFSVGVILYQLIYRCLPWTINSTVEPNSKKEQDLWIKARQQSLFFSDAGRELIGYNSQVELILKKALSINLEHRFCSADEFISALRGEIEVEDVDTIEEITYFSLHKTLPRPLRNTGKGFAAIAGLSQLKEQLQRDVIDALQQPEKYAQYGLSIPNGMLLYGPPGCGKTFFAKRFAEEVGFNFMLLTPSSLKSRYVNATQENIARMFEEAIQNAPTIVFIDEINELVPNRESNVHEMSRSAVNEMLAQMDRTGEKGVFVIGATNYPHQIDPAMLRAGRLERKIYLPPPDIEARAELFSMYLKGRPVELGIDYEELVRLTEGYVSADIEALVNDAARFALSSNRLIGQRDLKEAIRTRKASLDIKEIERYDQIRRSVEQEVNTKVPRKIGFT